MSEAVLDSSAVLAILHQEPGAETVKAVLPNAIMSAVNLAEVITRLAERGLTGQPARTAIDALRISIIDFTKEQAELTGDLRPATRAAGLSLGDRACLALSQLRGIPALTSDSAWATLKGFDVIMIRPPHRPSH